MQCGSLLINGGCAVGYLIIAFGLLIIAKIVIKVARL